MANNTKNIMIVGVGGQGTLLTSRILGGITASNAGQDVLTGILTGAALCAVAGVIVGSGNVAMISGGLSSLASKGMTDAIGATMYGTEVGSWEDYTIAFVFGGVASKRIKNARHFCLRQRNTE